MRVLDEQPDRPVLRPPSLERARPVSADVCLSPLVDRSRPELPAAAPAAAQEMLRDEVSSVDRGRCTGRCLERPKALHRIRKVTANARRSRRGHHPATSGRVVARPTVSGELETRRHDQGPSRRTQLRSGGRRSAPDARRDPCPGGVYELVPLKENRDRRETAQRRCGESRDSRPTTIRQQEEHRDTHRRGSDHLETRRGRSPMR